MAIAKKAMKATKAKGVSTLVPHSMTESAKKQDIEMAENEEEDEEHEEEEEEVSEGQDEEKTVKQELASRGKELKAMPIADLKELVDSLELERGNKSDMIKSVLKHEEKIHKQKCEKAKQVRMVVEKKKEEFTSLSAADLKAQCLACAITGTLSKQERVESLLKHWLEDGGIDAGLLQIKYDNREAELTAMPSDALQKLCNKAGVDAFVKDVMVDRLIWQEELLGKFKAPALGQPEEKAPELKKGADLVASLLAEEEARAKSKLEQEKQKEREKLIVNKAESLKSETVPELKKRLSAKGLQISGTKDELVKALLDKEMEDEALVAKKAELKALGRDGLKELLASKGLEPGSINEMIDKFLKYEVECAKELKDYESRTIEQLKLKKAELDAKSGNALKDMCIQKGLATGGSIEDRVQRLLRDAKESGEIDHALSLAKRAARKEVLNGLDKIALETLCIELQVDPLVKPVLVERLLHHEMEAGLFKDDGEVLQPASKKQRTGKKSAAS